MVRLGFSRCIAPHVQDEHARGIDSVRLQRNEMRQLENLFEREVLLGLRWSHATLASSNVVFDHQTCGGIEREARVEDVAPSDFGDVLIWTPVATCQESSQHQSRGIGCNWK